MTLQLGAVFGKLGGADVEEHPVSGVDLVGTGTKHPLVSAAVSGRTLVTFVADITKASTASSNQPQLYIGDTVSPVSGVGKAVWASVVDTDTEIGIRTNTNYSSSSASLSGAVYVSQLE